MLVKQRSIFFAIDLIIVPLRIVQIVCDNQLQDLC